MILDSFNSFSNVVVFSVRVFHFFVYVYLLKYFILRMLL